VIDAVRQGVPVATAARAEGASDTTISTAIHRWRRRELRSPILIARVKAIVRAEAEAEQEAVRLVRAAAKNNERSGMMWWLERRYPDRWAPRQRMEITQTVKQLRALSDEEVAKLAQEAARSGGAALEMVQGRDYEAAKGAEGPQ